jgi:hypothetical protein
MGGCQVQQECKLSALLGHRVNSARIKRSKKLIWSGRVSLVLLSTRRAKYRIVPLCLRLGVVPSIG